MRGKNRYFIRSRISERKFREIIKLFAGDITASQIALFSGVSRNCVNRILKPVRIRMPPFVSRKAVLNQVKWKWMKVILEPDE